VSHDKAGRSSAAEEGVPTPETSRVVLPAVNVTRSTDTSLDRVFVLAGVVVPFAGTLWAMVLLWQRLVTWRDVQLLAAMYVLTGFGITVGFHRMLTHRSFQAHPVVRFTLLALGCMAGHTDPLRWASIHIQHHAHSDAEGDPHSPLSGLFYAHFGWIYAGLNPQLHTYGRWLLKKKLVIFFQRSFVFWVTLGFVIPYLVDGWQGVLWGGLVRIFLSQHVTWSVNSICHTFGGRPYATGDRSTNHWLVGTLAFGEGWHNNHHAFPRSALHGISWWQIDPSAYLILGLERLGLVWNVHRVPPTVEAARRSTSRRQRAACLAIVNRGASRVGP
jgi:stearoyl-CoA desaturase (Delta-9 desaturase)